MKVERGFMDINFRDSKECFLKVKGKFLFVKLKFFVCNSKDKVFMLVMRVFWIWFGFEKFARRI